jgi:hypothetical protein
MLFKEVESQEKGDVKVDDVDIELDKMFWTWDWNRYADHSHALCHAGSEFEEGRRRLSGRLEIKSIAILAAVALRLDLSDD